MMRYLQLRNFFTTFKRDKIQHIHGGMLGGKEHQQQRHRQQQQQQQLFHILYIIPSRVFFIDQ